MSEAHPHRACAARQPSVTAAWGPLPGLEPVQEYRQLAHELQCCFPEALPEQLDRLIAHEMLWYGGHSTTVVIHAMLQASLHLQAEPASDAQDYVQHSVAAALQPEPGDSRALGWEG